MLKVILFTCYLAQAQGRVAHMSRHASEQINLDSSLLRLVAGMVIKTATGAGAAEGLPLEASRGSARSHIYSTP